MTPADRKAEQQRAAQKWQASFSAAQIFEVETVCFEPREPQPLFKRVDGVAVPVFSITHDEARLGPGPDRPAVHQQ